VKPIQEELASHDAARSDLEGFLGVVRGRWKLIGICVLIATLVAAGWSMVQEKKYTASASLLFRDPGFAQDLFGADLQTQSDPAREAATNVKLVGLAVVAERTSEALDDGTTPQEIRNEVSVSPAGASDVVTVSATDPNPKAARQIANIFAREFVAFRAEADRSKLAAAKRLADRKFEALTAAQRQTAGGEALSSAAERLGILASLQTGNAELVQPAELPSAPSSPKPLRNSVIGGLLGLVIGLGFAFLFERIGRPLRDPEDAQEAFGLPVVGTVPESRQIAAGEEWLAFAEAESFQTLRGALRYFNLEDEIRSVLITSESAREGKSTVAWNLAMVAASSARTLLVEADLRQPSMAVKHSLFPTPGLTELLTNQVDLRTALQTLVVEADDTSLHGGGQRLDILVAGAEPPNPAQLLEGSAMSALLRSLLVRYEFVVIDTPPAGVVSDAFPLLGQVDGVLTVCRLGATTESAARTLRAQLDRLGAPILGIVANGVRGSRRNRRYGYGYYDRRVQGVTWRPDELDPEFNGNGDDSSEREAGDTGSRAVA